MIRNIYYYLRKNVRDAAVAREKVSGGVVAPLCRNEEKFLKRYNLNIIVPTLRACEKIIIIKYIRPL